MNRLYGSIPPRFAEGCELRNLNLNGNQLEGPLPQSLSQCKNLEVLDLGNNKIDDTYPAWLEMLPKLQVLVLRSNKLHGFITDFGVEHSFSSLRIFDISNNDFTGTLPVRLFQTMKAMMNASEGASSFQYMKEEFNPYEYSMTVTMKSLVIVMKISTIFTSIDLSLNEFQGNIPGVIGELHSLKGLNLSHNRFDGLIPPSMGNLRNLEWLDLSSNNLIGDIPQELTSLTFLSVLNLSHNHLTGRIPLGKQFNTFSNGSFEGNLRLCGFPLSKTCNNNNETQPPSSTLPEEDHSGAEKGFISWKVVFMGYGCGIIFGVSMGYIVFTTGKPKWFVKLVEGDQKKKSERLKKKAPGRSGR
ncbi:receptor like protein 30-like [Durio zibethinus]|uniref:Receptor like protein 30-like n=1 Tax=Durio zibethinus TaxID=66656 RepID=A0A6P5WPY4_DURZI|nr:receptor like protein 30-like [Durio zibethinus]